MNRNEREIYENTVVKIVLNFCNHKKHKNYLRKECGTKE
jgi:hypothetical protein